MNREAGLHVAVALLAIGALGVSATTFESTVRTDAADVVDLDYDLVPIGQDDAVAIVREMEAADDDGTDPAVESEATADGPGDSPDERSGADAESADGDSGDAERGGESSDAGDPGEERADADERDDSGSPDQSGGNEQDRDSQSSGGGQDERTGTAPEQPSLLDRLLALLADLAQYLLLLVALAVLAGLALRYWDRLRAALGRSDPSGDGRSTAANDWLDGPPSNAVDRAWIGMVRRLELDRPASMTPSECAAAAVEAGYDREAVRSLTEAFREVQYGGRPVTDRHEEIAARSSRRLDLEEAT